MKRAKVICVVASLVLCAAGVGVGLVLLTRRHEGPPAPDGPSQEVAERREESSAPAAESAAPAATPPAPPAPERGPVVLAGGVVSPPPKPEPLPPPAKDRSGVRAEYARIRKLYDEGRPSGWAALKAEISTIRDLISTEEGFGLFLALIDQEKSAEFIEALLHHLPLAAGEHQSRILQDEELHEELWSRAEDEEDPARRRAFLRFFSYQPGLSSKKMDRFVELAAADPAREVRLQAMDAISSAGFPEASWPALYNIADGDTDEELRAIAIEGLARARTEEAAEIVRAAFTSDSEAIRAAAWRSEAGTKPPEEATGGDTAGHLARELRAAVTREYRAVLMDRLLDVAPALLSSEIAKALQNETDRLRRQDYQKALRKAEEKLAKAAAGE